MVAGSQKLTRRHEGPSPKIWIRTKILSPSIRYFVAILVFVAFYTLFGRLWANRALFGSRFLTQEQCFLGKECTITWYVVLFFSLTFLNGEYFLNLLKFGR